MPCAFFFSATTGVDLNVSRQTGAAQTAAGMKPMARRPPLKKQNGAGQHPRSTPPPVDLSMAVVGMGGPVEQSSITSRPISGLAAKIPTG